jgi:hypothetical protein
MPRPSIAPRGSRRRDFLAGAALLTAGAVVELTVPQGAEILIGSLNAPPKYVQRPLRGNQSRKYVIVVGDSFAKGMPFVDKNGVPLSPGAIAAASLGLPSQILASDGAGLGTLEGDQFDAIAKMVKAHGPPAAVIVTCCGNDSGIDYSVAFIHAMFSFPNFNETLSPKFREATRLLQDRITNDVDTLSGLTEGAVILWTGYPKISQRGPFLDDTGRVENLVASEIVVNSKIRNGVLNSGGKATWVDVFNALTPDDVFQADDETVYLDWIADDFDLGSYAASHLDHPNGKGVVALAHTIHRPLAIDLDRAGWLPELTPAMTRGAVVLGG